MDTDTLPTAIPVPVDVPPGLWRRENTHCPQPMSPIVRGILPVVTECFRRAFAELGVMADTLEYREIGGWVYTGVLPLGGYGGEEPPAELIRERAERALDTVRSDRYVDYVDRWPQWRAEAIAGVTRLRGVDVAPLGDQELVAHLGAIMEFAVPLYDLHLLLHSIGAMMLADLAGTCRELLGWDDARALELLCGLSTASTHPAGVIAELTAMARDRPEVRSFIESENDPSRLWDLDPDFAAAFAAYQHEFGFRSIRYDIIDPSIEETPSLTVRLIADQLRSGFDPAGRAADAAGRRQSTTVEARALLADRCEADRARFDRALERASRWYHVREDEAPMTFSDLFGLIRRVTLQIGQRLTESSLLHDPDDVFWLELEEAVDALMGRAAGAGGTTPDCRSLAARRRAERRWVEANPGPRSYGDASPLPGLDELPPEARFPTEALLWLVERSGHFTISQPPQPEGERLTGVPVSGGTYTGVVRVVLSEADFDKLQPASVLVCPITSPAWSVLFPNVGALVADAGGLMSHSAIIAREFQIPAVVATGNATALLSDGQVVTVDGTAGTVEVLA